MAHIKITALPAYADPASTDVLPIVDIGADVTKNASGGKLLVFLGADATAILLAGRCVMAVSPGTYNINLQRRADYSITLQFKDSTDTAINLAGWTVAAQAWNKSRTKKYADFTVTYTDRSAGTVAIALTDEQTALLPDEAYYDVLLTNPGGLKDYYLEGIIYVSEGYTA